jgi:hypothetical protein
VQSRALLGLEAAKVTVEVHLANGLPSFTLVGLAEVEVKEARERVRCAIQNSGLEFPTNKRIKCSQAFFLIFVSGSDSPSHNYRSALFKCSLHHDRAMLDSSTNYEQSPQSVNFRNQKGNVSH